MDKIDTVDVRDKKKVRLAQILTITLLLLFVVSLFFTQVIIFFEGG